MVNKKGQLAIFVIIAILLVAGVVGFFMVRSNLSIGGVPGDLRPVYNYYESCIEKEVRSGLDSAGMQGGKVNLEEYSPGSEYAPFSNQLNFLGNPVGYWYYLSGNGVIKENPPTKNGIEKELEEYIASGVDNCDFSSFYEEGYDIEFGGVEDVEVSINDDNVDVDVRSDLVVRKNGESAVKNDYGVVVGSEFGRFYSLARQIYDKQRRDAFLEEYGIDVLRNYAPVDGVEIQCGSKVWKTRDIIDDLQNGLEANIAALKIEGNNYELKSNEDKYFVVDGLNSEENVRFMYSKQWPMKVEIEGDGVDNELIVADPVGNQEGMGMMGFCYIPYHYVYDVSFPVLVQIYNEDELFQFPIGVIIDNNLPREVDFSGDYEISDGFDLCEYAEQDVEIGVYDINLNGVDDADVSYECFSQRCSLGKTENGIFSGNAPQCVNGFVHVRKEGFVDSKKQFSTNSDNFVDVILDREYELDVDLRVGGSALGSGERAVVSFNSDGADGVKTGSVVLGEGTDNTIVLSEGSYDVTVYVYTNTSLTIPSSSRRECASVSRGGLLGMFGSTKEECFDVEIPETKIESGLIGGGSTETYVLESELEKGNVVLSVQRFSRPDSIEALQYNFASLEDSYVGVSFE